MRCPKCRSRLRVWPENHGPPFTCSSSTCPVVGRLRSTGANRFKIRETTENQLLFRFTCFLCNFDLCESCLTRKLGRSLLNPEPSRTPARETSSSCLRGSWCFGPTAANSGPMDPSAPLLPVHEEPPPSYQEAIRDREWEQPQKNIQFPKGGSNLKGERVRPFAAWVASSPARTIAGRAATVTEAWSRVMFSLLGQCNGSTQMCSSNIDLNFTFWYSKACKKSLFCHLIPTSKQMKHIDQEQQQKLNIRNKYYLMTRSRHPSQVQCQFDKD